MTAPSANGSRELFSRGCSRRNCADFLASWPPSEAHSGRGFPGVLLLALDFEGALSRLEVARLDGDAGFLLDPQHARRIASKRVLD